MAKIDNTRIEQFANKIFEEDQNLEEISKILMKIINFKKDPKQAEKYQKTLSSISNQEIKKFVTEEVVESIDFLSRLFQKKINNNKNKVSEIKNSFFEKPQNDLLVLFGYIGTKNSQKILYTLIIDHPAKNIDFITGSDESFFISFEDFDELIKQEELNKNSLFFEITQEPLSNYLSQGNQKSVSTSSFSLDVGNLYSVSEKCLKQKFPEYKLNIIKATKPVIPSNKTIKTNSADLVKKYLQK